MRFRRKTLDERLKDKAHYIQHWHKKFAWWPVRLESDDNEVRWFEFVLRRGTPAYKKSFFLSRRIVRGHSWRYAESSLDVLRLDQ